jgi:signal transduction histidine kinase
MEDQAVLDVRDDGVGFDHASQPTASHARGNR